MELEYSIINKKGIETSEVLVTSLQTVARTTGDALKPLRTGSALPVADGANPGGGPRLAASIPLRAPGPAAEAEVPVQAGASVQASPRVNGLAAKVDAGSAPRPCGNVALPQVAPDVRSVGLAISPRQVGRLS